MGSSDGSMVHGPKAMLSKLPSVDRLIHLPASQALVAAHGAALVTEQARALLAGLRQSLLDGALPDLALDDAGLTQALRSRCEQRLAPRMKPVLNLTGTVIHTNLGRAVLAAGGHRPHLLAMMAGPNNLEYDLATGGRGDRDSIVEGLLCEITGAEAATVVNNNAAAVLLTIAALGAGQGGDRLARRAGGDRRRLPHARRDGQRRRPLVEVGTTNRTHPADYERAINPATALLMKVHTSNYAVQGFTSAGRRGRTGAASRTPRACRWPPTWAAARWSTWPVRPAASEPHAAGDAGRRLRRRHLLRRQAARWPAGRPDRRQPGRRRAHPQVPDEARACA